MICASDQFDVLAGTRSNLKKEENAVSTKASAAAAPVKKPFNWPLFWAYIKFWVWNVTTKSLLTIVYLALISQGLRYILPDIGLRLYKLPGLAFLEGFRATYPLDLAHIFSAAPLVSAWILWHLLLEMYLRPDTFASRFSRWNVDRLKRLIITMGAIIIVGDACLFCAAFTLSGWGPAQFSASAVLATAVYVTILGFSTLISILLSDSIDTLKKKG